MNACRTHTHTHSQHTAAFIHLLSLFSLQTQSINLCKYILVTLTLCSVFYTRELARVCVCEKEGARERVKDCEAENDRAEKDAELCRRTTSRGVEEQQRVKAMKTSEQGKKYIRRRGKVFCCRFLIPLFYSRTHTHQPLHIAAADDSTNV